MPWRTEMTGGGVVVIHEGPLTVGEIEARAREVDELIEREGLGFRIGDFRLAEPIEVSVAEMHALVRYLSFSPLAVSRGRQAFVVLPSTFAGMEESAVFMLESWLSSGLEVKTFEDFDEALHWASALAG